MIKRKKLAPTVSKIVEQIEADIIICKLLPREELPEHSLMEKASAKRHEVRAAIEELIYRRLIIKPVGRTARVIDLSPKEVQEIYDMRTLLQQQAAHIISFP